LGQVPFFGYYLITPIGSGRQLRLITIASLDLTLSIHVLKMHPKTSSDIYLYLLNLPLCGGRSV
jgi:hypothetical protein